MIHNKIIIGCMSWGIWGKKLSQKQQIDLISFCIEQGNTTFDHADIYGDYTTEIEFGNALTKSGINRKNIQLISKCGIQLIGNTRNNAIKHYNYSKNYIIGSAEQSLKKLKTDYLDVFLLHRPSPLMQADEIAEAITYLQKSGKIIKFGVSNFTPLQVELISKKIKVSVNQIEFSLTQHEAMQNGSLNYMQLNHIQPMSWSPLGAIFKPQSRSTLRVKNALNIMCEKYNTTPDVILLSWILKHPANILPVIGTTQTQRILNANKASQIELELEDWFLLLEKSQGHEVP